MHRRFLVGLVVLALLAAVVLGGVLGWRWLRKSELEQALGSMPAESLRVTYTDWSAVRAEVGGGVGAGASAGEVSAFVDRAYDSGLAWTSSVAGSTAAMASRFGFSAVTAQWEAYGQSPEGAVAAMRLPEGTDFAAVERRLARLGYDAPAAGPGSGGVWAGSPDLVAQIDPSLTPVLQNLVVLPDERIVLMSDAASYASSSADVLTGDADGLVAASEQVASLARVTAEPVTAVVYAADFACSEDALSMAQAGPDDQALADQLVADAGGVSPLSGLVLAHEPDGTLLVRMAFESADQAEENLRPRAELAAGEAVGQGGSFTDRFTVEEARQEGSTLTLTLEPVGSVGEQPGGLLSDLADGPVLFATC